MLWWPSSKCNHILVAVIISTSSLIILAMVFVNLTTCFQRSKGGKNHVGRKGVRQLRNHFLHIKNVLCKCKTCVWFKVCSYFGVHSTAVEGIQQSVRLWKLIGLCWLHFPDKSSKSQSSLLRVLREVHPRTIWTLKVVFMCSSYRGELKLLAEI